MCVALSWWLVATSLDTDDCVCYSYKAMVYDNDSPAAIGENGWFFSQFCGEASEGYEATSCNNGRRRLDDDVAQPTAVSTAVETFPTPNHGRELCNHVQVPTCSAASGLPPINNVY